MPKSSAAPPRPPRTPPIGLDVAEIVGLAVTVTDCGPTVEPSEHAITTW
ncbi:hypothetical protein V2W30_03385 [Streptomyces sp. Q6]|uniref:Uncharacterized protein n=1 Tax=Streptomyces citrinus TaxID=3118173 RepID=A0ACD5A5V8_9ACTN